MPIDDYVDRVRTRLPLGDLSDVAFDELLPPLARAKSSQYWSPLCVARRVALLFSELGSRRVLDVGCGPGKFCIAAAFACPELEFCGVEQRAGLVEAATDLALRLNLRNVQFSVGDALLAPWHTFDGFYFFNPFSENVFGDRDRFDDEMNLSTMRFGSELLRVESLLSRARMGTVLVTYHGLTGPIPSSYELVAEETAGSDWLRTWVQRPGRHPAWAWLETAGKVIRVSRADIRSALVSLICDG